MPSLSKRPNGVYYLYFFDATKTPKRKGVSTGETTKRKAEDAARRLLVDFRNGLLDVWPITKRDSVTCQDLQGEPKQRSFVAAFLASRSNLSAASQRHYGNILARLICFLGSEDRAILASANDVFTFLHSTAAKPVTQHHYRRHLRAFYRWLMAQGAVLADPTEGLRLERAPSKYARFLSPEDVEAFCKAAADAPARRRKGGSVDVATIVRANVQMGLRLAEVVNLQWADVDLEAQRLFVRCRGGFTTKSKAERCIPLSKSLSALFRSLPRTSPFVFTTQDGAQINPMTLSKTFRRIAALTGLAEGICFHSTRHTAASWLAQRGVSVEAIRMLLGHSSISVTQRYMHLSPEAFASQVRAAFDV